ncbi:MAG: hypothetical protein QGG64_00750 [Candidatus Latescibacteria bacterium]|nr:hypothetical protein [Candidatus Latescibacterota bacterium]
MNKQSFVTFGLLLCFVGWGQVHATQVKAFAFDGLCETAQTIVHVKCLARDNVQFPDRDGIFTQTRFEVLELVKGQAGAEIALVLPGGEWEGRRMTVPGMPQFLPGEETVLFLSEPDDFGSPWPVGLGQGCYGVKMNEGEGRQVYLMSGHTPLPAGVLAKPAQGSKMGLGVFVAAVRKVLKMPERSSVSEQ